MIRKTYISDCFHIHKVQNSASTDVLLMQYFEYLCSEEPLCARFFITLLCDGSYNRHFGIVKIMTLG